MSSGEKKSVLVDTSFLITLFKADGRSNHDVAKKYFKYFIENGITMYLSTIVISEFHRNQPITDLILSGNYRILPFNYEDSISAAEAAFQLEGAERLTGDSRVECKDDIKLIGQARVNNIDFIITDDESTLCKYCRILNATKLLDCQPIVLSEGFDESLLNGGQVALTIE